MSTYTKISTVSVGSGGASTIDFTSIPATYTDLLVKFSFRGTASTADRGLFVQFNNSSSSIYTYRFLRGDGSSVGASATTTTFLYFGNFPAATQTANVFGNGEIVIPNYASSNNKAVFSNSVSGTNWSTLVGGVWASTNAITSVKLYAESGNLAEYSSATLYGIKSS